MFLYHMRKKKQGLYNALFSFNLNSGLCIRLPLIYLWDPKNLFGTRCSKNIIQSTSSGGVEKYRAQKPLAVILPHRGRRSGKTM